MYTRMYVTILYHTTVDRVTIQRIYNYNFSCSVKGIMALVTPPPVQLIPEYFPSASLLMEPSLPTLGGCQYQQVSALVGQGHLPTLREGVWSQEEGVHPVS